jgi:hypothetical protein
MYVLVLDVDDGVDYAVTETKIGPLKWMAPEQVMMTRIVARARDAIDVDARAQILEHVRRVHVRRAVVRDLCVCAAVG